MTTDYEQANEMIKSNTGVIIIAKLQKICNCYEVTHNINRRTENKKMGLKGKTRWFISNYRYTADGKLKPVSDIEFCPKKKGESETTIYGVVWVFGELK